MPTLLEKLAARFAYLHARRVHAGFLAALDDPAAAEQRMLRRVLSLTARSEFGRQHGLRSLRAVDDLRRALPIFTYEDYRPLIDRLCDGDAQALFSPGQRLVMFATSSGTTAAPKRIPVTPAFVRDYRRGWNIWGLKVLSDHPRAVLRHILQSSSRHDAKRTPAGIPCGAITGLLARTQKRIVRRFYVARPEVAQLRDPQARYYLLMRLGVVRDVAFAVTANPATLIQMARTADGESETLFRDVRDGTLSRRIVVDAGLRRALSTGLKPAPGRAAELERCRAKHGALRPRDYWQLDFVACWTAGSMGHYLQRLADWWGPVPVRDVGLLASEGRVSVPLEDNTAVGVLDVTSGIFEFIPAEQSGSVRPDVVRAADVQVGHDYVVVLTNTSGLLRYRLDDVVRVHGRQGRTPLIEFLYRAGRVASVAGEKLTENQVVAAVKAACDELRIPEFDFVMAPCWADPPHYRLSCAGGVHGDLPAAVDQALGRQNEEYASRRKSNRLGPPVARELEAGAFFELDRRLLAQRQSSAEQYKRPCLFTQPGEDDALTQAVGAADMAGE